MKRACPAQLESVGRLRYCRDDLSMVDEWGSKYLTSREICLQSRAWRPLASWDVVPSVGLCACIGERDMGGASTCEEKLERFTGAELFTGGEQYWGVGMGKRLIFLVVLHQILSIIVYTWMALV